MDAGPDAHALQLVLETAHVARDLRADEGVQADRREPLVLTVLRQDLRGDREERLRELLSDDCSDAGLVIRVQEREQEAHRDGLDACLLQLQHTLARPFLVERNEHLAVPGDSLGHRPAIAAADDRIALPGQILIVREVQRLLVTRDVQDVPVALRGQHPDLRPVVLDDDVGRDRRSVEDLVEVGRLDTGLRCDLPDSLNGSLRRIVRCRRQLVDEDRSGLVVDLDQVRERPADVDAYTFHPSVSFTA
jgi:hypothetical protein